MPFFDPVPGLVIRYSYLWRAEYLRGQEEGVKDRPCAVILTTMTEEGDTCVTVLPITHTPPTDDTPSMEIPARTKARLGMDTERSWVILTEANRFIWPGPDLRPVRLNENGSAAYGLLPAGFFNQLRLEFIALVKARQAKIAPRTK